MCQQQAADAQHQLVWFIRCYDEIIRTAANGIHQEGSRIEAAGSEYRDCVLVLIHNEPNYFHGLVAGKA